MYEKISEALAFHVQFPVSIVLVGVALILCVLAFVPRHALHQRYGIVAVGILVLTILLTQFHGRLLPRIADDTGMATTTSVHLWVAGLLMLLGLAAIGLAVRLRRHDNLRSPAFIFVAWIGIAILASATLMAEIGGA